MHCLSPFLNVGTTFAFFHSDGNLPERKQFWKINSSGLHMEMPQSCIMRMLIMSWRWALLGSRFFIILYISSFEKIMVSKHFQAEPQLQSQEILKRWQQVSKCNGCKDLFDKTDKKIYVVLLCQKRCLLSCGQYLDVKEVEILSVLKDINKGIITGFGMKTVEHKNDFHVRF